MLHSAAAAALARSFSALANGGPQGTAVLTPRQREIIELLVLGMQNKQIARRLGIGVETVKTHISRILDRLGVSSRTEAVVVALRDGLVA
jgi:DNA-binding NarL/FixJ family response regulator